MIVVLMMMISRSQIFKCFVVYAVKNLGHCKRLVNTVIREIDGFYSNNIYYGDTDSAYIHKKHWSTLVDDGFVSESPGLGKNEYDNAGIFYAWFEASKIKSCFFIKDYGVISAKRSFKGFSEENRMIKLDDFISLSEGKTVSERFSNNWTKTFEGVRLLPMIPNCLDCDIGRICSDCVIKPKLNCFNSKLEKGCLSCLDLISQKKTNSTDNNLSKNTTSQRKKSNVSMVCRRIQTKNNCYWFGRPWKKI